LTVLTKTVNVQTNPDHCVQPQDTYITLVFLYCNNKMLIMNT